jgi:radical SAM protein with 4Fe4S-binding SPASM domain
MEAWYDQWLKALNCAVLRGPSTFGGLVADVGVADMAPPGRKACSRLASRITILSDGRIVSCEEDIVAAQTLGHAATDLISEIWTTRLAGLRTDHRQKQWAAHPLCATCNEWHRP